MISSGNKYFSCDYVITTASIIYSSDFMSVVGSVMAVAGVQLFN